MNNLFRGLIAGYGAKKLGGGCFSTILVFIVIWYLLGKCGNDNTSTRQTAPANGSINQKPAANNAVAATTRRYSNYH